MSYNYNNYNKYIKYKNKYINLRNNMIGGVDISNIAKLTNANIDTLTPVNGENFNLNPLDNLDPDKYIDCIALKTQDILMTGSNTFIGNIGNNNKTITIGQSCKDDIFNIKNPTWCYMFVTTHPDLIIQMKKKNIAMNDNNLEERLKQLLGLHPTWGPYTHIIYMSIKVKDLFRPCLDNKVTSTSCPIPPKSQDSNLDDYSKWFYNWFNNSHSLNIPFTGLGYTYDWNKPNDGKKDGIISKDVYGVQEYVIKPGAEIIIKHIYTLNNYLSEFWDKVNIN